LVKVTKTTRVHKASTRRCWAKFGHAAQGDRTSASFTIVSKDEICVEPPRTPG
jgi:hypothetical protein